MIFETHIPDSLVMASSADIAINAIEIPVKLHKPMRMRTIEVRRIPGLDENGKTVFRWLIRRSETDVGPVLNRLLEWEYNSSPSSRTNEEIERTRYHSMDEAFVYLERYLKMEEASE